MTPPWIRLSHSTRSIDVPSYFPSRARLTKFVTVFGACSGNSLRVISPMSVTMTATSSPGSG